MAFDIGIALTWILFIALFPIAFVWLRRVWKIVVRRDFSEVALKRGESPPDPARYAVMAALINFAGGVLIIAAIGLVVFGQADYEVWSALAGVTIWCKVIFDFALGRHAHNFGSRPDKPTQ